MIALVEDIIEIKPTFTHQQREELLIKTVRHFDKFANNLLEQAKELHVEWLNAQEEAAKARKMLKDVHGIQIKNWYTDTVDPEVGESK